jgi:selenium-binding protein 1
LLSLLKTQDTAFYWDVSDPYHPKFTHSNRALLASITDEIRAKPEGGFFITYMGSAVGTSPGRLIETDARGNIIHEWPEDVEGTVSRTPTLILCHLLTSRLAQHFGRAVLPSWS